VLLRLGEYLVELLVRAVGLDVHPDADLQPLQVEFALQLGRELPDRDAARRRVQDERRGDASGERVQQELDRIGAVVAASGLPERSLKRRFKVATGSILIGQVQNLRIEEAKRLLESGSDAFEDIAAAVGYENPAFFRRLFKRATGLTPGQYRRMFRPFAAAADPPAPLEPAAA